MSAGRGPGSVGSSTPTTDKASRTRWGSGCSARRLTSTGPGAAVAAGCGLAPQSMKEMFDAAERHGRLLVEAFMYRCHPAVEELIQTVRRGAIGQLKLIRTHFTFNRPEPADDIRYQPGLAGGSLMDIGCYCVNRCTRWLTCTHRAWTITPPACSISAATCSRRSPAG